MRSGFEPYSRTPGNQQFFWMTRPQADRFAEACGAEVSYVNGRPVSRFVTSWATQPEHVEELLDFARGLR